MAIGRFRTKREYMELISYSDMSLGALSIFFSSIIFVNYLPLSREGYEVSHDIITVSFMFSVIIHFLQLFQAVRLLNSTEHRNFHDDPEESIRLANLWQNWSLFFLFLLLVKFYIIHCCYGRSFPFLLFSIFIGLEFCFRIHSRYSVKEFITEINVPQDYRYYSPYMWNDHEGQDRLTSIIRLIFLVDLIQPLCLILIRAWAIIFRSVRENDETSYHISLENSTPIVILIFVLVVAFYIFHMTIALKLLSALDLLEIDPLNCARNAKIWQSWSILFLFFLIGHLVTSIVAATAKLTIVFATLFGITEILWRCFGIYQVGILIDKAVEKMPSKKLIPTVKFFNVRFPVQSQSLEQI